MKKILFIVPSLTVGGMERMQVTLANALDNLGYSITIMTLNPVNTLAKELNKDVKVVYKPYKEFPIRCKLKYIWTFYDEGVWETRASSRALHRYYVGKEKYDVEIAFFRGLPIKILGFKDKKAIHLAWVHNDFRKAVGFANNFKSIKCVQKAYASYNKIVCVSSEARDGFKEVIGDTGNLKVIYNMLPVQDIIKKGQQKAELEINRAKFHVVLVGRLLDEAKGQKRLIKVISKLHDEGNDISLALVGGGKDKNILQNEIYKCNATGYISMTDSQLNPYPYIKQADLAVCASYYEGYNLTVAESLILWVPVLSTNCTVPNEILDKGKYGKIVENSENGLYIGIKEMINSPELMEKYKRKAVERQDFFCENKILGQIVELIEGRK